MADPWTQFDQVDDSSDDMHVQMLRRGDCELPKLEALASAIWTDMDKDVHGVAWWSAHLFERQRILISDYLCQCVGGVGHNLFEASLHKIAALNDLEAEETRLARMVKIEGASVRVEHPPPESPRDTLNERLIRMHTAGFFRSLGSSLDCLAANIIGVLGLPENILTADFKRLRKTLPKHSTHKVWVDFTRDLTNVIDGAGPTGWDSWVSNYRNMLVHRARRLEFTSLSPTAHIVDRRGQPVLRAQLVPHLVRAPALSDVEAMAWHIQGPTVNLEESGRNTLGGAYVAMKETIEKTSALLIRVWELRRASPGLIPQPPSQWPGMGDRAENFVGFEPGSMPISPNAMVTSLQEADRVRFAALDDKSNSIWKGYI